MTNSLTAAELVIGADLRTSSCNVEWRRMSLPGTSCRRERVDKLFPESDVAACALDVLASGIASENLLVRMNDGRYLLTNFYPSPSPEKPKQVRMQAWEMRAQMVIDADTGDVLETIANEHAAPPAGTLRAALNAAAAKGSQYLGRFQHRRPDGSEVELESVLVLLDEGGHN